MDPNRLLQIRPSLAWEHFPDEVVAIDLERGIYFNLTGAGAQLFRCFAEATSLERVAAHLGAGFSAGPEQAQRAMSELVSDLERQGLLVAATGPAQAALPGLEGGALTVESLVLHRHDDLQNLLFLDPVHDTADEGWPARQT